MHGTDDIRCCRTTGYMSSWVQIMTVEGRVWFLVPVHPWMGVLMKTAKKPLYIKAQSLKRDKRRIVKEGYTTDVQTQSTSSQGNDIKQQNVSLTDPAAIQMLVQQPLFFALAAMHIKMAAAPTMLRHWFDRLWLHRAVWMQSRVLWKNSWSLGRLSPDK